MKMHKLCILPQYWR